MTSLAGKAIKRTLALIVPAIVASAGSLVATPTAAAATHSPTTSSRASARSVSTIDTEAPAFAEQALKLVNQQRAEAGCASLPLVAKLQFPAERQSRDQAARDRLGHDGANGSTVNSRLSGLGYSRWAENVAQFPSAQAAVHFWSTSRGHRATMRNCAFRETGLAVARSNSGKFYWTETFGD